MKNIAKILAILVFFLAVPLVFHDKPVEEIEYSFWQNVFGGLIILLICFGIATLIDFLDDLLNNL